MAVAEAMPMAGAANVRDGAMAKRAAPAPAGNGRAAKPGAKITEK